MPKRTNVLILGIAIMASASIASYVTWRTISPSAKGQTEFSVPRTLGTPPQVTPAEERAMADLATLVAAARNGKVTIPTQGAVLRTPLTIQNSLHIEGNGNRLLFADNGLIDIPAKRQLTIQHSTLLLRFNSAGHGGWITLHGADLTLRDNRIHNLLPSHPASMQPFNENDNPWPNMWLVSGAQGPDRLNLIGNRLSTYHPYSMSGVYLGGIASGQVRNNDFEYLHRDIFALQADDLEIADNRFFMSSFGAVNIGGRFTVARNQILYPGAGVPGDGISVHSAKDSMIQGNVIFGGSCYGIWVKSNAIDGLDIGDNFIGNGITGGLYILATDVKHYRIHDITIHDNIFSNNAGFGIAVEHGENIRIDRNTFQGNAPHEKGEVFVSRNASVTNSSNSRSVTIDPAWAQRTEYFRSHVLAPAEGDQLIFRPEPVKK